MSDELRRNKGGSRQVIGQCSICKDGELLNHYNKMLLENEENHNECITEKKEMMRKIDERDAKISALE